MGVFASRAIVAGAEVARKGKGTLKFWTAIGLILVLSTVGLTYEIAAGRVLAPFYGTSLLTWTTVIATVLAGFSLGSAIGGVVAERDRRSALRSARLALVGTAALAALSPTLLGLLYSWGARDTGGMIVGVVIAFFPASVLVSVPSPLLAKLAVEARPGREGSSLGLVLAAGSLGAIFGALLAGFVALPIVGSAATFSGCGAVTLICALLIRENGRDADSGEPGSVLSFAAAALVVAANAAGGKACRYESDLSCIDIVQDDGAVYLYSDRTQQAAERLPSRDENAGEPDRLVLDYTRFLWARMDRDLGRSPSVLFIGGGGYTLPTRLLASRPDAHAVAVEIDPLVTDVVRRHMPWAAAAIDRMGYDAKATRPATGQRLGIAHADGRVFLNETDRRFDAAVVDAFSSGSVPAHLATLETYERLADIVDGPVYVNLIDSPDGRLVRGVHAILIELYPYVQVAQSSVSTRNRANIILAASHTPLAEIDALPVDYEITWITPGRAFTDDRGWTGHR